TKKVSDLVTSLRSLWVTIIVFAATGVGHAQLRLPGVFSDHMVIQQNATVAIWGWSHPTQDVMIKVSWDTTTTRTKSANTTFWRTNIKTPAAGGPHTITVIAGHETRTIQDVLAGEVWLCSG